MTYEYYVHTVGTSVMDSLEEIGQKLQQALDDPENAAYVELGWELWQFDVLNDGSGANNGLVLVYRKPKA